MTTPIYGRLKKLYKHKAKWARRKNFEAFRLYERDIPDYPFIVDIYKDYCQIYFRGDHRIDDEKEHLPLLKDAIQEITGISSDKILYNERFIQNDESKYSKKDQTPFEFSINEGNLKFKVILNKYIDTGLFLDHRPLRQELTKISHDKKVLNLFCYTGSLSVASASVGAKVTSVDMSKTYLNWAKENFILNNIDEGAHDFIQQDVFKFLKDHKNKFDLIILDPPTFSQSKKMDNTLDIQRDQDILIEGCMKLLSEDGVLYFSNNLRDFKLSDKVTENYQIKDMTLWSIPEDFRDKKIHKLFKIKHS